MKITTYKQLDLLVAQSLEWVEAEQQIDMGEMTSPDYFNYFAPKDELDSDDFDEGEWVLNHGECPSFSLSEVACDYILEECDHLECIVMTVRTKDTISFLIRPEDPNKCMGNPGFNS